MRAEMPIWLILATPILGTFFLYFLKRWFSELWFYRHHHWDFSTDNPSALQIFYGVVVTEKNRVPNKQRVYFGYPLFVFITGVLFFGFAYGAYRIQTCKEAELKMCGIFFDKNGKMTIQSAK